MLIYVATQGMAEETKKEKTLNKNAYVAEWQTIYGGKEDDIAYGIVALEEGDSADCREPVNLLMLNVPIFVSHA